MEWSELETQKNCGGYPRDYDERQRAAGYRSGSKTITY